MHWYRKTVIGGILLAAAGTISSARADIKLVSLTTYSGNTKSPVPAPVPVTTFYKGKKTRVESAGSVTITDSTVDKVYTLDPAKKTYYVSTSKAMLGAMADNPMLALVHVTPTIYFHPGGQTQTIAGKTAQNYKYQATFRFSLGDGAGAPAGMSDMLPTMVLTGEVWATEQVADQDTPQNAVSPLADNLPPFIASGIKALTERLKEVKGVTLSTTQTLKFTVSPGSPIAASLPAGAIVVTSKVTSVSEEPLADTLFSTEGYTEVAAPPIPVPAGIGVGNKPLGGDV